MSSVGSCSVTACSQSFRQRSSVSLRMVRCWRDLICSGSAKMRRDALFEEMHGSDWVQTCNWLNRTLVGNRADSSRAKWRAPRSARMSMPKRIWHGRHCQRRSLTQKRPLERTPPKRTLLCSFGVDGTLRVIDPRSLLLDRFSHHGEKTSSPLAASKFTWSSTAGSRLLNIWTVASERCNVGSGRGYP